MLKSIKRDKAIIKVKSKRETQPNHYKSLTEEIYQMIEHTRYRSFQVNLRRFLICGGSGKDEGNAISFRS